MINPNEYHFNTRCKKCDTLFKINGSTADFYNGFPKYVCKECGNNRFYNVTEKYVFTGKWYKPKTWGDGKWVTAQESDDL